jgi:chemotaxis signal transduction protein
MKATSRSMLLCSSGKHLIGVPLEEIVEVVPAFSMKTVSRAGSHIAGLINFRGNVLAVIDGGICVHGAATELDPRHRFIIVSRGKRDAALLVEDVDDLVMITNELEEDNIRQSCSDHRIDRIVMHGGDMVFVLDLDACLSIPEEHSAHPIPVTVPKAEGKIREY